MGHSIMLNWDMVSLTSSEYRRRNLETLATHWESKGGKLADLAELIGMSPSYFSQLRSGARGVGDKTARKIEAKLEWPRGALDHVIGPPGSAGQALPIKHWPTLEEQEHALKNVVLFPDADILGAVAEHQPPAQSRPVRSGDEDFIAELLEGASPRTRDVLLRLAESARTGRLTDADVELLGQIGRRLEGTGTKS